MKDDSQSDFAELRDEIRSLRAEVQRLNDHNFIKVQNSTRRMLTFMLMRGLALGLGTVIGASVLVSILAFVRAQIDFIPIIGEWAQNFAAAYGVGATTDQKKRNIRAECTGQAVQLLGRKRIWV